MRTILAAASIVFLASTTAFAQTTPSTTDAPATSGQGMKPDQKQSPGTTGAMQNESSGVATSPQDVQKQGTGATAPSAEGNSGKAGKETGGGAGEKPK